MNLKEWFLSNNYKNIQDTGKTWQEVGELFNITGDAARNQWRRFKSINNQTTLAVNNELTKSPKILIFDIETSPMLAYVWKLYKENISPVNGQLQSDSFMLTYSAKWLFDNKMYSGKLTSQEAINQDDSRILREMWYLLNEADIVIAHFGSGFDIPFLNARFVKHGMYPPMPYKTIDTLKHAKKQFRLPSYKLDYLGTYFGLGNKIRTDFSLWEGCMRGNTEQLSEMELYNMQDVKLLEDIYLQIRPYIQPHPNLGLYITENIECCPSCTSKNLDWEGEYTTYSNSYDAFRCKDCGSIGRSKVSKYKRKNLTKPIPIV